MRQIFLIFLMCIMLSGCLTHQKYSFTFDFETGVAESSYYDIRSKKGVDEKDYSLEKDWELLKSMAGEDFGQEFDTDVIKPVKAELFKEGKVLSAKKVFEVQSPKAFPNKVSILDRLHTGQEEGLEFQEINGEIFLFSRGKKIVSSNGEVLKSKGNHIVVWPGKQTYFEFTLDPQNKGGESLLSFYLEEQNK